MKKFISSILVFSMALTFSFAASKKQKSKNTVLDAKKKFAIEGVELGSIDWCMDDATLTPKGEIIWNKNKEDDWLHYGWELRGTDMSKYAGLKIQVTPFSNQDDLRVEVENPASLGDWTYSFGKDGICYVLFNGQGIWYGEMKNPAPEEGFQIRFLVNRANQPKTVIKSIELLSKEDYPDVSHLDLLGVKFGSSCYQTRIVGNEVTWLKGYQDGNAGWNLEGIDLSEYDRIRVEIESNDATGFEISMSEKDGANYHAFSNSQIQPGIYEADINGEGYSYINEDGTELHKSEGLSIFLHTWNEKPRTKEQKTVVKSVQLLKGKRVANENLMIEGKPFGTANWYSNVYDGGVIEWQWDGKEKGPCAGWNVKGVDFTKYKKIRIELDPSSDNLHYEIRMAQGEFALGFNAVSPYVLEANFDGSDYRWRWPDNMSWDLAKGIDEIQIRTEISKKGYKTIVKSVKLIDEEDNEVQQPEAIMLYGKKLGSQRDNAWIDEDFAINWKKANWAECGWKFEKLDGDIVEVKVTSTDAPLRFRIADFANNNEASYIDNGTHIFRVNVKTKKQINTKGTASDAEWVKSSKPFDFSQGGKICLEPANGVYKEGKKTVVESITIE